jgi:hypothetical protein
MIELGFISKDDAEEYCCELNKAMYGNVDALLQWMKTFANFLMSDVMDMNQSLADPCMFYKKDGKIDLVLLVVVFVDNVLLGGTEKMVKWFKTKISTRFNFTDLGKLRKHLGVWYEWGRDKNGDTFIKATMDSLIDETIEAFRNMTGHYASAVSMPGYPGKVLQKHKGEEPVMLDKFRSLTGKIMYVEQKIMPMIANAARKLAQHMSHPGEEHWKALECLVGYLGTTKGKGLIYRRPKELQLVSWADLNYATNEDTRRSVSGIINTLGGGTITNWTSKTQATVTLSSMEAEYLSLLLCTQDLRFTQMLLNEIDTSVTPGIIHDDNTGAIFLVKNSQVGFQTKHIDVRHHFI